MPLQVNGYFAARALLELLGSCIMTASLFGILWFSGIDFMPRDVAEASFALGASVMLGFGMGIINAIIAMAFCGWITGYALVIIVFYISPGVMFVPDALPEEACIRDQLLHARAMIQKFQTFGIMRQIKEIGTMSYLSFSEHGLGRRSCGP